MRKLLNSLVMAVSLSILPQAPAEAALPDPAALGVALELGNVDAARTWLDEGMDPNREADRIGTGLMIGAWEGNLPLMELFVDRGADIERQNRHGEQALQLAAWRGKVEAVRWLLDRGAKVNRDGKNWSALHYAVFAGHEDVVRLLMERGAEVDARAPNDSTALMMAAREGRETLAKTLIDAGADARLTNDNGDSALATAMRHGNFRIAKLVSSSESFSRAVQSAPESFGTPIRSEPVPVEIGALLQQLRQAEVAGQPTDALRQALMEAIESFRKESTPLAAKSKKRASVGKRPTLVITASRKSGGERAEMTSEGSDKAMPASAATPAQLSWRYEDARINELTALLKELEDAQQKGKPTESLRRQVREAYQRMKTINQ